jgi:xanthine dehydrogenase accessory factor
MSLDRDRLERLVARHGRIGRVVVAGTQGSAPREAGAAMCVWADGQDGTIGGGALEWQAAQDARAMLAGGAPARVARLPLGPALGQCCGGAVTLASILWDAARLGALAGAAHATPLPGAPPAMPLAVRRILQRAREGTAPGPARIVEGWLVEAVTPPARAVWIWGAGHVGRAAAAVVAPLPGLAVTLVDTDPARLPDPLPPGVAARTDPDPVRLVADAPGDAAHLVMTFSHPLDLALCDAILRRDFGSLGLIGSASKAARFRARLTALGHAPAQIARIDCPIGDPSLGKHPQAIAVGVAAALLSAPRATRSARDSAG